MFLHMAATIGPTRAEGYGPMPILVRTVLGERLAGSQPDATWRCQPGRMKPDRSILKAVLIALGALLYGASPVDVIPELFTGPLGLGDDAVALALAAFAILRILRARSARQRSARRGAAAGT
jgi:uncharacterized membrane protein YkvA (DUF1232 family)